MKRHVILFLNFFAIVFATSWCIITETIPVTWDLDAIKRFHLPPPDSTVRVVFPSVDYYQSLPEHVIYKTFPVYVREFEKNGYQDSLRKLEPEVVFDAAKIKTEEDWIHAGEVVFNWPVAYSPFKGDTATWKLKDFDPVKTRITRRGEYAFNRYVITEKGKLIIGNLSCASCHTRVLDSGEIIPGAQGNVTSGIGLVKVLRSGAFPFPVFQQGTRQLGYAPWGPENFKWVPDDANEAAQFFEAATAGVVDRQGSAFLYPLSMPSLIGLKDIKYLDHTGIMKHESPGDLMRYAAFNQGMDMLVSYNGYIPGGKGEHSTLPAPAEWSHPFGYVGKRYSDVQLYALTKYIYSLKPPKNPNKYPPALVKRGSIVFAESGCVTCHTPPLYTNNKLTPVNGFEPPADHFRRYDIFNVSVETDSVSALYTRRGTGYYKVPSLRGVWYRSAFFHNGNLTTLDEVLSAKRLQPDYLPTGYKPPNVKSMAVKGHPFGMDLSENDRKALIAFLKTL